MCVKPESCGIPVRRIYPYRAILSSARLKLRCLWHLISNTFPMMFVCWFRKSKANRLTHIRYGSLLQRWSNHRMRKWTQTAKYRRVHYPSSFSTNIFERWNSSHVENYEDRLMEKLWIAAIWIERWISIEFVLHFSYVILFMFLYYVLILKDYRTLTLSWFLRHIL